MNETASMGTPEQTKNPQSYISDIPKARQVAGEANNLLDKVTAAEPGGPERESQVISAGRAGEFLADNPDLHPDMQAAMAAVLAPELVRRRDEAERAAKTDSLTGLPNRAALDGAIESLGQSPGFVRFVHMDLDNFKELNDTAGHEAGNVALKIFAQALSDTKMLLNNEADRSARDVFRQGGDEFVAIVADDVAPRFIEEVRRRFHDILEAGEWAGKGEWTTTAREAMLKLDVSAGGGGSLAEADRAMYEDKKYKGVRRGGGAAEAV
jgi:diguanylate cyclase (GGDEF)-like protein